MTPALLMVLTWLTLLAPEPVQTVRVVMPASGVVIEAPALARWEVAGTVLLGARDARAVDRLLGADEGGARLVTVEIKKNACPPAPSLVTVSPWPRLGYEGIRTPLAERRAVKSCKMPDLDIELRFPPLVPADAAALLEEANHWEPLVAALHAAYGATRVDVTAALAAHDKLALEPAEGAPDDVLARVSGALTLRDGVSFERSDNLPWVVRDIGGHDVLALVAPTHVGLSLQLLPFRARFNCDIALETALKGQPPAPPGAPTPTLPPGWQAARPVGAEGAAFCVKGDNGGYVAIGGARVARDLWLPLAAPLLARLAARL